MEFLRDSLLPDPPFLGCGVVKNRLLRNPLLLLLPLGVSNLSKLKLMPEPTFLLLRGPSEDSSTMLFGSLISRQSLMISFAGRKHLPSAFRANSQAVSWAPCFMTLSRICFPFFQLKRYNAQTHPPDTVIFFGVKCRAVAGVTGRNSVLSMARQLAFLYGSSII